ncbi:MAG: hypothetical protein EON57_07475, partial [Alphaproteobacteria bacterium]
MKKMQQRASNAAQALLRSARRLGRPAIPLAMAAVLVAGCTSATLDTRELGLSGMAVEKAHQYPIHGIDVSKYQGDIDWDTARKGGVSFAYLKATEGGDRVDQRFAENWRAARAAGMPRGAYHFFY